MMALSPYSGTLHSVRFPHSRSATIRPFSSHYVQSPLMHYPFPTVSQSEVPPGEREVRQVQIHVQVHQVHGHQVHPVRLRKPPSKEVCTVRIRPPPSMPKEPAMSPHLSRPPRTRKAPAQDNRRERRKYPFDKEIPRSIHTRKITIPREGSAAS